MMRLCILIIERDVQLEHEVIDSLPSKSIERRLLQSRSNVYPFSNTMYGQRKAFGISITTIHSKSYSR